jgi:hypothetical protein
MNIVLPDSQIIFDDDIMHEIKAILRTAQVGEEVYVVSPYIRLDTRIKETIEEAMGKNIRIYMLMRMDADHSIEDVKWLLKQHVILWAVPTLHAKAYISPRVAVISSMNLHSFSGAESKEIGIIFRDESAIQQLLIKVKKWMEKGKEVNPFDFASGSAAKSPEISAPKREEQKPAVVEAKVSPSKPVERSTQQSANAQSRGTSKAKGFCIRCGEPKTFNAKYPLCDDCYKTWAKYKNADYEEEYCHRCGKENETSVAEPLCKKCAKETVS